MIPVPAFPAVTCPYGKPGSWSGGVHGGADFGSPGVGGAQVVAPWSGTVIGVRNSSGSSGTTWGSAYGTHCVIDFDPLPDGSPGLWGVLAHLKDCAVSVGQRVAAGQAVGHVNSTGNSTGNHLHFEVQRDAGWNSGNHVDPQPWIAAGGTTVPPFSGWLYPAGTQVHGKYLRMRGHEQNADGKSVSIGCWQDMLNRHPLQGGQTIPVTEQWFDMTAAETQKCQAQHVPPPDDPLDAVFVGPSQFEHVRAATGCPYVWAG